MTIARELEKLLTELAQFGSRGGSGIDRPAFSPIYEEALKWVAGEMLSIGMSVRRDAAGNLIGRMGAAQAPAVVIGSHIDTVPSGGRFDGALGVMAGLAAARRLAPHRDEFKRALEVVSFADEEGTFGLTFGSRAMAGCLSQSEIEGAANRAGRKLVDALAELGLDPGKVLSAARPPGDFEAYLELHIEQGPVLEGKGIDIGAVEAIAGIDTVEVTLTGEANHSGTTPATQRRDALRAAAEAMVACHTARPVNATLNFGALTVRPGATNIVPAEVTLTQEIRSSDHSANSQFRERCGTLFSEAAGRNGVTMAMRPVSTDVPARMAPALVSAVAQAAQRLGHSVHRMPSGAGHDAQYMAALCPAVMIFVPSVGGISHSPRELSTWESCGKGAEVLTAVAAELLGVTPPV